METASQSQVFDSCVTAVAEFAGAGLTDWRATPVDVLALCRTPAVQKALADLGPGADADVNAQRDAIEAAIEVAAKSLPFPFDEAALDHFGFTDEANQKKTERERRAAAHLRRTSQAWYGKPCSDYYGMKPRDYVIALVAAVLCGSSDPLDFVAQRQRSADASHERDSTSATRRLRQLSRPRLVAVVTASVIGLAIIGWTVFGTHRPDRVVASNTVVNATSGAYSSRVPILTGNRRQAFIRRRPVPPASRGGVGLIKDFSACVLERKGCRTPRPPRAKAGEVIAFQALLTDPYPHPVPELKLFATTSASGTAATVELLVEWRYPNPAVHDVASEVRRTSLTLSGGEAGSLPNLSYEPKETRLEDPSINGDPEGAFLARLPDGLFTASGVSLSNLTTDRSVVFFMRVVKTPIKRLTKT